VDAILTPAELRQKRIDDVVNTFNTARDEYLKLPEVIEKKALYVMLDNKAKGLRHLYKQRKEIEKKFTEFELLKSKKIVPEGWVLGKCIMPSKKVIRSGGKGLILKSCDYLIYTNLREEIPAWNAWPAKEAEETFSYIEEQTPFLQSKLAEIQKAINILHEPDSESNAWHNRIGVINRSLQPVLAVLNALEMEVFIAKGTLAV